jgi:hypothetical protein
MKPFPSSALLYGSLYLRSPTAAPSFRESKTPVLHGFNLCAFASLVGFSVFGLLGFSIPFWFNRRLVDVRGKLALEFLDSTVAPAFCNRLRHRIREDFLLLFLHPV